MAIKIGIDTGGTYTDAVVYDSGEKKILGAAKALTTKEDLALGIGGALDSLPQDLLRQARLVSLSTTLATNACVEGKGGRARLVFIGDNRKAVHQYGAEYGLPDSSEIWFLHSRGTMQGEVLEEPDWEAFLRESDAWLTGVSAVAVVELNAMWNNGVLEKKACILLSEKHSLPVICGHELFSDLNSLQRAAGTLLNARLIPIIAGFLASSRQALGERGIAAPIVIVRSDGSVMSESFTSVRPVETLLCGPAASVKGGMELAREPDCLVVDMGGTTTDVAIVKGGAPKLAAEGISIGNWRTFVKGVFIETFGLGGDSAVRIGRARQLQIGPERVMPLSAAASKWPVVTEKLQELVERVARHSEPLHEFFCLVKDVDGGGYTDEERAFCKALKAGPLILSDAAKAVGRDAYSLNMRRLEREGVVLRCGLTPTDAMHASGDFDRYDSQAALLGARFVASCLGSTVEALCEAIYDEMEQTLYTRIVRLLLDDKQPGMGSRAPEELIRQAWLDFREGAEGFAKAVFQTHAALVGVGAPTHLFLPRVAEALGTRCVIPENAGVANAFGALVGSVTARVSVEVSPQYDVGGIQGYIVHGRSGTVLIEEYDTAIAVATQDAKQAAIDEARLRGAAGEIAVATEVRTDSGHAAGTALLLAVFVSAVANGSMAL